MYNIKALEEEWKRYNKKKKRPWILTGIFIVLGIVGTIAFTNKAFISQIEEIKLFKSDKNSTKKESKPVVTVMQKPSFYLDKPLQEPAKRPIHVPEDNPLAGESIEPDIKSSIPSGAVEQKTHKKLHIEVIDTRGRNGYKEVEKRFRLGHDTDDSLFLAKAYYRKRQYKKAEYWALQTNKINDSIEESWLIFAKAKAKRGQKNEAKRILRTYIKKTNSSEAKVLLEKIKKGMI
jgi:hypothetical protein